MKKLFWFFLIPGVLSADFGIRNQIEFHAKYQKFDFGLQDALVYFRFDGLIHLPKTWQLYLRSDVPFIALWGEKAENVSLSEDGIIVSPGSPGSHMEVRMRKLWEIGLGDVSTRFFFVTPFIDKGKKTVLGFGSEIAFPTAQEPDIGTGRFWARPIVGIRWDFPHLGNWSWFSLLFKYQFSFAGDKSRPSFQIFSLQPVFIYTFGDQWSLIIAPESQYNVLEKTWFVPAAINFTKGFSKHYSMSLGYQRGVITDFAVFRDEVEFIVRYSF